MRVSNFTDDLVHTLISEPKPVLAAHRSRIVVNYAKREHLERSLTIEGTAGNQFRVIIRQRSDNPATSFAIVLVWLSTEVGEWLVLVRYDGNNHQHSNPIEKNRLTGFHVHRATQRYMESEDFGEDRYAEATNAYSSYAEAVRIFVRECALLFEESVDPVGFFDVEA